MRFTFKLRFYTRYGQSLFLSGKHDIFGDEGIERAIPLRYEDGSFWGITLVLPRSMVPDAVIPYNYVLKEPDGTVLRDWGADRTINPASCVHEDTLILDSWNSPAFIENAFYTEPFQQVLLPRAPHAPLQNFSGTHLFRVKAPLLGPGKTLCLLGDTAELGHWNVRHPVLMQRQAGELFFVATVDLSRAAFPVHYKYGVFDLERQEFNRYEDGANRWIPGPFVSGQYTILNDGFAVLASTTWKGAGVAIPVFSLRSHASFGVGEFADLKLLVNWAQKVGLKLIQILPVNDTTSTHRWMDSYPYAAISTFALHPQYIRLSEAARNKNMLAEFEPERLRLNQLSEIDYEGVMALKMRVLRALFEAQKNHKPDTRSYTDFVEQNKDWLVPYAQFCFLRDKFRTSDTERWPAHKVYDASQLNRLFSKDAAAREELDFHWFTQFHLHLQLKDAADYAHQHGIILKGDIPIGVHRLSTDVWQHPELFHTDMQAGAPPDAFAAKGQNWGFPTYNWPQMKADRYAWWRRRFEQMARYFDAFRIDHILGFFRIWSIPRHAVEGILGHFVPAIPVTEADFLSRGIPFDPERFARPYITPELLEQVFEEEAPTVRQRFFRQNQFGRLEFKPEFSTQRRVAQFIAETDAHESLQTCLFDLLANVILLEEFEGSGNRFHFRLGMENTSSFQALDPRTQWQLRELYLDYFFRRQDHFWAASAFEKLPDLKRATNMLVCGEDLGMVPACVPDVMRQLGLLGLEVQRMPKDLRHTFSRPQDAPYLSVVTPSTHDMSTLRGWWREDRNLIQEFYNTELGLPGAAPTDCESWVCRLIIRQHLASPAMWSIFQLQDLFGMDEELRRKDVDAERINVPANTSHYWRYRMHVALEELLRQEGFNQALAATLQDHGR